MIVYEQRACTIIYNIITSIDNDKPFLIPSNLCPIVVAVFLKANRAFEFIDISNESLCIDENVVLKTIKKNPTSYAGILFVRSYGTTDSFDGFFSLVKKINNTIFILDDWCLAPPSFDNKPAYADVNLYSTGYSKYVDINGGAYANCNASFIYIQQCLTYNAEHLTALNASFRNSINKTELFNFNLIATDWLDTSVPALPFESYKNKVLQTLPESSVLKEKFNARYGSLLPKEIQFDEKFQNWRFNIKVKNKEELMNKVFKAGLFVSTHYAPATMIFYRKEAPNSDALYSSIVNLFSDRYFLFEKTEELIAIINQHVEQKNS